MDMTEKTKMASWEWVVGIVGIIACQIAAVIGILYLLRFIWRFINA